MHQMCRVTAFSVRPSRPAGGVGPAFREPPAAGDDHMRRRGALAAVDAPAHPAPTPIAGRGRRSGGEAQVAAVRRDCWYAMKHPCGLQNWTICACWFLAGRRVQAGAAGLVVVAVACSRRTWRRILPAGLRGMVSVMMTWAGRL